MHGSGQLTASIIVPTRNGGSVWRETLRAILSQEDTAIVELIVVDSDSSDGTFEATEQICADPACNPSAVPLRLTRIPVHAFGHGHTRNRAAATASGDVLVFLSQDATPANSSWLAELLRSFEDPRAAGAFCRQIARGAASVPERFNIEMGFPEESRTISREAIGKTSVLFSNAASAIRRGVWQAIPFDEDLLMCEDQHWALEALRAGHTIVYNASAAVLHSHQYSWRTLVSRYFDSIAFLPDEMQRAGAQGYRAYLRREIAYVAARGGLRGLPGLAGYETGRMIGYGLAVNRRRLPRWVSERVSSYPRWFGGRTAQRDANVTERPVRACFLVCNTSMAAARVRREAQVVAGQMPTTVLAVPGPMSILTKGLKGAQLLLGMAVGELDRITYRDQDGYRAILVPWPGKVAESRAAPGSTSGEQRSRLPAGSAVSSLIKINLRLAVLASYQRAAIYHAHDLDTLPAAAAAAFVNRAKLIYDAHELWPEMSPNRSRRLMWTVLEKYLIRRADSVVTINRSIATELTRRYGVPCSVLYNYPTFHPVLESDPARAWRQELGLPGDAVVVRYHGLYLPERGLEELVRAVPLLDERVVVTFQGYGPIGADLKRLAQQLHVESRVFFLDPLPSTALVAAASAADIGIAPLQNANGNLRLCSPNKVYEYLHAGLALVVSDLPELRAIVDDTGAGTVCDPRDLASVADALNRLVSCPAELARAREAARRAAPRYSWEHVGESLTRLYAGLTG